MKRFWIDLRRQLQKRLWSIDFKSWIFLAGTPALLAILLMAAFLVQNSNADRFCFFATLYAFWLGLFGSCQTLNGEVASGEWGYWVLGNRLGFGGHLAAVATASLVIALSQIAFFTLGVLAIDLAVSHSSDIANGLVVNGFFHGIYVPDDKDPMLSWRACQIIAHSLLVLALSAAAFSGVSAGMLFSTVFYETATSVRQAVAVTVLLCVISATALKRDTWFPPIRLWLASSHRLAVTADPVHNSTPLLLVGTNRPEALLEDISILLPQRYFFNVTRILNTDCLRLKPSEGGPPFSLYQAFGTSPTTWTNLERWAKGGSSEEERPHGQDRLALPFLDFLFRRLILPELSALLLISSLCLGAAYLRLKLCARFYEIRC